MARDVKALTVEHRTNKPHMNIQGRPETIRNEALVKGIPRTKVGFSE